MVVASSLVGVHWHSGSQSLAFVLPSGFDLDAHTRVVAEAIRVGLFHVMFAGSRAGSE